MSEVRIVATLIAKPEHKAAIHSAVERVVEPSRQEMGNIQYDLHEEIGHKGTYVSSKYGRLRKRLIVIITPFISRTS